MDPGGTEALSWEGLDESQKALQRVAVQLLDLRPFWSTVADLAIDWIGTQFEQQGAFMTGPWAPLSPAYAAWKAIRYPGRPILAADGDLRRAATTPKRDARPLSLTLTIEPYTKRKRSTGRADLTLSGTGSTRTAAASSSSTKVMQPGWFQEGTARMPARPLVGDLPEYALDQLDRAAEDYVDDILARAGLGTGGVV